MNLTELKYWLKKEISALNGTESFEQKMHAYKNVLNKITIQRTSIWINIYPLGRELPFHAHRSEEEAKAKQADNFIARIGPINIEWQEGDK